MATVLLTSASGAPGVTSTAVGLALVWPSAVLLADCDRTPSQAVLAGYLRGADAAGVGMMGLARAHREGRPLVQALGHETIPLALGEVRRMFLPGFATPGAAQLFEPAWPGVGDAFSSLGDAGIDTVVDAGRMGPLGPPAGLLMQADAVLVLCRTNLPALSGLRLHLPVLRDALDRLRGSSGHLGLVLVGEGQPYTAAEVQEQFGVPVWDTVPDDPKAAAVLGEGTREPRKYGESGYVRALRSLSSTVLARIDAQRRRIWGSA